MANPGGPNEIGAISVGVVPDLSAMAQVPAAAAKAGEDAGKAHAEGFAKGAKGVKLTLTQAEWEGMGGHGPTPSGPGSSSVIGAGGKGAYELVDSGRYMLAADGGNVPKFPGGINGPVNPGGATKVVSGWGAGGGGMGGDGSAMDVAKISAALYGLKELLETLSNGLFSNTEQMIQLRQGLAENQRSLSKSIEQRESHFSQITGGNLNISDSMNKRISEMEREKQDIEDQLAQPYSVGDVLDYAVTESGLAGGDAKTGRQQQSAQVKVLDDKLANLRKQASGVTARQRAKGTLGGILRDEGFGDPNVPMGPGPSLSPSDAAYIRDQIKLNPDWAKEQAKWQQMSYEQQQKHVDELRRGVREVYR